MPSREQTASACPPVRRGFRVRPSMALKEERWRSAGEPSRAPVRGPSDAAVRRRLELDELDQPPVRAVPPAVRVHIRVTQAIEQRTNPRTRGGRVLHLLTEDIRAERAARRMAGSSGAEDQPVRCKRV